jgi:hypothetical protein
MTITEDRFDFLSNRLSFIAVTNNHLRLFNNTSLEVFNNKGGSCSILYLLKIGEKLRDNYLKKQINT